MLVAPVLPGGELEVVPGTSTEATGSYGENGLDVSASAEH